MWKISRNILFTRWTNKQSKYVENTKPPSLSKSLSSIEYAEKKKYSDKDQKQKQQFKQNDRFWNCEQMKFLLFKASFLEKVGWLGTVTVLCFNFHFKHLNYIHNYAGGESYCLFSKNVLAMPNDFKKEKRPIQSTNQDSQKCLSDSTNDKTLKAEVPPDLNCFDYMKQHSIPYAAAVHNISGLSEITANSKKAFKSFQRAAYLGSTQAFYNLGLCYELGNGTKVNLTRAAFCYKRAAVNGHGLASYNLAVYYLKGIGGLPVDPEAANILMSQAAEKNISEAQMYLGLDYLENSNYSEAFQMFTVLAKKSVLDGKYYLGMCYENGWGTNKDEKVAFEMYSDAASSGHERSLLKLSKFYEEGIGGCEQDLDLSTALCQMLSDQSSEEWKVTLLRLKLKKEITSSKKSFMNNILGKPDSNIHKSVSVPELSSCPNQALKTSPDALSSHYLGLITPIKSSMNDSTRGEMFHIGEEKAQFSVTGAFVPHFQISLPQLMIANS
ncbi:uncharacterized protein [Parasteatoda tepidariorum]|uniref:uncharacterized protein isoform X1 n=2 Tax=Parasteatoda tepidariorum TaxID=114398 RepID=UPI001C729306|nr:uncharacterized protein LOC107448232 isoform X1 [Parasteatoda tepidariorum]